MSNTFPEASSAAGGGLLSNLLGGFSAGLGGGSLAGTNSLQTAIDTLTNAVNKLNQTIGGSGFGGGNFSGFVGGTSAASGGFPPVINPFRMNVAGGGNGGAGTGPSGPGNITQPTPFGRAATAAWAAGTLASGFAQYGQNQMTNQIALDTYVRVSQLGMSSNGGWSTAQLRSQAFGMYGRNLNYIATSPMDALAMTQQLQYMSGAPLYMGSAMGRAGFGATAGFAASNPSLSGFQASQLASQLYAPSLSQRMLAMGYPGTPRALGGGTPSSMGNIMQSILQGWYNKNSVSPGALAATLGQGGRGYLNLQALGLDPTQMTPALEMYNKLFARGLSANAASNLVTQAMQNPRGQAMKTLKGYGITTTGSDIQAIKSAQAVLTGRISNTAEGFNEGLQTAANLLTQFNSALSSLMTTLGLNRGVGFAGGFAGMMSGTNQLVGSIGGNLIGGLLLRSLLGGGAAATAGGTAATAGGVAAAAGETAAGGSLLASAAPIAAPVAAVGLPLIGGVMLARWANKFQPKWRKGSFQWWVTEGPGKGMPYGGRVPWAVAQETGKAYQDWLKKNPNMQPSRSGGAASGPIPSTSQSSGSKRSAISGNISASAVKAVGAAESQLGVPYLWGGENPGVGFDCSGLTQWAYAQAGVKLPRTSQEQWAALSRRSVPTTAAQEGDLVFMAGSDGTANAPGHVGLMISRNQLIQAPYQGKPVQIIGYDPRQWQHAARPSGTGSFLTGTSTGIGGTSSSSTNLKGNTGMGPSLGFGNYGSVNELDAVSAALMALGSGGAPAYLHSALGNGSGTGVGGTGSTAGPKAFSGIIGSGGNISQNRILMQKLAAAYGWNSGAQWNALNTLVMHESGYNQYAQNPTSTAYGIGQFLDSTWGSYGPKTSDPRKQEIYMLEYIKNRYGSPVNAWSQYYNHPGGVGWYSAGGRDRPGLSIVGERGPELMMTGGGNTIFNNAQTMAILKAVSAEPAQSPWTTNLPKQATSQSDKKGHTFNITFGQNSINISAPSGSSDTSQSGRVIAQQIVKHISNESVYAAIAAGEKM